MVRADKRPGTAPAAAKPRMAKTSSRRRNVSSARLHAADEGGIADTAQNWCARRPFAPRGFAVTSVCGGPPVRKRRSKRVGLRY
jgi:hypothetical protein